MSRDFGAIEEELILGVGVSAALKSPKWRESVSSPSAKIAMLAIQLRENKRAAFSFKMSGRISSQMAMPRRLVGDGVSMDGHSAVKIPVVVNEPPSVVTAWLSLRDRVGRGLKIVSRRASIVRKN